MDPLRKVKPGDPAEFPAAAYNAFVDAAIDYRARRRLGSGGDDRGVTIPTDLVKVRNSSGSDLAAGSILELGDPIVDVERGFLWFDGDLPSSPEKTVGVLLRPCPDGEIEYCQVSGVAIARVNMLASGDYLCGPDSGSAVLESGVAGMFRIIHAPTGTGEKTCVIKLDDGGASVMYAKAPAGGISAYSGSGALPSATCELYTRNTGTGALVASGVSVTVYSNLGAVSASADIVVARNAQGEWMLLAERCT